MGMSLIVFMIICFNNIFLYTYIYHFFNLFKAILYLIFRSIIICIFNFKYSYEYVSRFDGILERKKGIEEIDARFRARAGR